MTFAPVFSGPIRPAFGRGLAAVGQRKLDYALLFLRTPASESTKLAWLAPHGTMGL